MAHPFPDESGLKGHRLILLGGRRHGVGATERQIMKIRRMATTLAIAGACAATVMAPTAAEAVWYQTDIDGWASPDDPGGYDVRFRFLNSYGHVDYQATFVAQGEHLKLLDNYTDKQRAEARVRIYNTRGELVDDRRYLCGTSCDFQLGIGGGNNVPEGYRVRVKLRREYDSWSADEAWGRA